ncbi:hypothetical protein KSP39_PZI021568 [Platanthera zijinensis]|uniref:RNase H type-1 domain-containing protein n=1 Tax=Platanthera zijinensis TaxID=2320716 RepID=A0AAP0AXV6_9ASPA
MAALAAIRDYLTVDCFDASGVIIEGDCLNLIKYCQHCFDSRLWDAHFPHADVLDFLFELPRVMLRYARGRPIGLRIFVLAILFYVLFFGPVLRIFRRFSEVVQSDPKNILIF